MEGDTTLNKFYMAFSDLQSPKNTPRILFKALDNNYYFDALGIAPNATPPAGAASTTILGDIEPGTRYVVVLFQTRSGNIGGMTDAAPLQFTITANAKTLRISGIPLGPPNCLKRVVAFTEAGASSAGPYFYIENPDVLQELNAPIPSTVLPDNISTVLDVNFTDNYLVGSTDVTTFFNKIQLPSQTTVYFSPTLRRLIWAGENPNIYRVSLPDDPESYLGTTGFVQPGNGDGQSCITAREFRGELYLLKSGSGYSVAESSTEPSTWKTVARWDKVGPAGPRAVDTSESFMAIAALHGLYLWDGATMSWASYEVSGEPKNGVLSWDRINKDYGHLMYVFVDEFAKEIRVGVPLDQSTTISHEFVLNYANGVGAKGRRWSYNALQFTQVLRMYRNVTGDGVDNRIKASQLVGASANPTGEVLMIDPSNPTDAGAQIASDFQTLYQPPPSYGTIYQFGGADLSVKGQGQLTVSRSANPTQFTPMRSLPLDGEKFVEHSIRGTGQSERFSIRVQMKDLGGWFVLQRVTVYLSAIWQRRTF
jgi:hypothetical protein